MALGNTPYRLGPFVDAPPQCLTGKVDNNNDDTLEEQINL